MTNSEYWKKRAEERKNHVSRTADEAAEEARESFERARHRINREVAYWIQKFADAEGISYDEARKMLEAGELEQFRMTLGEYIARGKALDVDPEWQDAMVKASALHHIDRLNALKAIIRAELEENKARLKRSQWMHDIADYSYEHTLFGIETGLEMQIRFRQPDLDRLHRDIEEAWAPDGIDFVDRVGINNDKLAAEVDRLLTQGMITGETYEELAKQLTDQFALKEYEAARIIRTEATRVASMSEAAAYRTAGLEEYEILVTLDERTCSICGPMDGHVERVDDMEPGVTAPPFHPNCRCTTIGHYEDGLIDETRIARDEDGNPIHVDGNMTWEEWYKENVEGNPKYEARVKAYKNRSSDRKQMKEYREILGSKIPNNIADFQELKYNNPEDWNRIKGLKKYLKKYPTSNEHYFDAWQEMKARGLKKHTGILLPPVIKKATVAPDQNSHDPNHIINRMHERGLLEPDIERLMRNAKAMFSQWGDERLLFVGDEGMVVIVKNGDGWIYKTAWTKDKFDDHSRMIIEVLEEYEF